jgi:PAS domain S-box-containing protein
MGSGGQELRALEDKLQLLVEASSTLLGSRPAGELPPAILDIARQLNALAASAIEISELHGEQERIRVETEHARQRYAFLAEASAVLSSSLDYDTTLSAVAELAVRQMADWCLVGIAQPNGSLKRLALAHKDPVKVEWARRLARKYPTDPNAGWGSSLVLRTGKSEILREIPDELLVTWARDAAHLEMLRSAGFRSTMCVPLIVRGRVLGTITFASTQKERRYGPEDLALAEDLARRAAVAVDHAILHDTMQKDRAMLEATLGALRENEVRLRMALDAGRMGIWDWDVQTRHLNPENLVTLYGAAAQEFDGDFESFLSMVHPEDRPEFQASFERVLQQKSRFEHEFRMVYPDGSIRWVAGMGKVYCDENDRPVRIIGLGMDVTERRSLEEKLRSSQKLESIGLLAGGIAHDFNNLLTGIMGNAGLALQTLPKPSPAAPFLENVVHGSQRAADLTQQLLAYAGKGKFVVAPLDLSALVRQIANLVQSTISKMVRLEMELDGSLPMVEADASQIQQVVMNLVINAAEAIGERGGTVRVKTGLQAAGERDIGEELKPGNYVVLEVQDTGSGMDRDTLGRIFDPFFTTKFTGRGLGLAAVSGIVRGHRGAIRVSSEPEKGSTFQVLFPASTTYAAAGQQAHVEEELHGSGLILVIDDEETVRSTTGAVLSRYGYDVELAEDGGQAVEAFQSRPGEFAIVLLDLTMPVLGGETVLRLIKKIRSDIPVIVSSGYSEADAYRRFPPGALAGFLQKPYTGATLARKVKAALCGPVRLSMQE